MAISLISVFCIFLGYIGIKTEKNILNPVTIISGLWGIIIFLSNQRLFTLYEASIKTYDYILSGIIAFFVGYYGVKILLNNKCIIRKKKNSKKYVLRKEICYIFLFGCILFIILNIVKNRTILFEHGINLASVQLATRENNLSSSGLRNAISFLIINPMYTALTVVICINFIIGDKDKRLFFLMCIMSLGRCFSTGGRQAFIQLFVILFVGILFSKDKLVANKKITNGIKNKIKIVFFVVFAILFLLILSLSRTQNLFKTIYLDFAMQPYMFETWMEIIEENNSMAYGFSSIMGFVYPILYVLKNLFKVFSEIPIFFYNIYEMNLLTMENWIEIGEILKANAYVSIFWYLYYDGRLFGIIFGMFFFGIISYNLYKIANKYTTAKNVSIYSMIVLSLFYSFGDMEFSKPNFALALIYILTIFFKEFNKENEEINDKKDI